MKLTDQQLTDLKALADAATPGPWWSGECVPADGHALAWLGNIFVDCDGGKKNYAAPSSDAEFIAAAREAIPALIADLREAQRMIAVLTPDALREAEERKSIAAGLESVWKGRMQDAETAHHAELAATRQQLAHWKSNHEYVVKKLRLFTQRDDLPVDRLPAYQHVLELEKQLAEAQAREAAMRQSVRNWIEANDPEGFGCACTPDHTCGTCKWAARVSSLETAIAQSTNISALQSVIAEAVEPYKRNAERYSYGRSQGFSFAKTSGMLGDDYIVWLWEDEIDAAISKEAP